jgi:hypothetical protein
MRFARAAGLVACAAVALTGAAPSPARSAGKPAHARPSLEGVWRVNFIVPMETPAGAPPLVVSEAEAKPIAAAVGKTWIDFFAAGLDPELPSLVPLSDGLPIVRGQRRTRAVIQPADGRLPYTPAVRKESEGPPPETSLDNPENLANAERCLVGEGQPPLASFTLDNQIQILRTKDAVAILVEYGDDLRIIPLKGGHAPVALTSRLGDSVGHFEGETLVIETVGLPDGDRYRLAPTLIVPGAAKVIERLTPVSDGELLYQFTVVDPKAYTAPWLAEFSWFRTTLPMYEHACHEGNYSMANELSGARHDEAVAKAKTATGGAR